MPNRGRSAHGPVGAKKPLKPKDVWAIRFFPKHEGRIRDRAMFDLAIDSKLRYCDFVKIKIGDTLTAGGSASAPWPCNRRLSVQCRSNCSSLPERLF